MCVERDRRDSLRRQLYMVTMSLKDLVTMKERGSRFPFEAVKTTPPAGPSIVLAAGPSTPVKRPTSTKIMASQITKSPAKAPVTNDESDDDLPVLNAVSPPKSLPENPLH